MKVICINNHDIDGPDLTIGKVYETMNIEECWAIRNDFGVLRWYSNRFLIPLDRWRENQLKKLGI